MDRYLLSDDPTGEGESRDGNERVLIAHPLAVWFEVFELQQTVVIYDAVTTRAGGRDGAIGGPAGDLERQLSDAPHDLGESRLGADRVLIVEPLSAFFEVINDLWSVVIFDVVYHRGRESHLHPPAVVVARMSNVCHSSPGIRPMTRAVRFAILLGLAVGCGPAAAPPAQPAPPAPPTVVNVGGREIQVAPDGAPVAVKPRKPAPPAIPDAYGDPLPPGAVLRLGTERGKPSKGWGNARLLPDGKRILSPHGVGTEIQNSPLHFTVFDVNGLNPRGTSVLAE
ncbi:MAG: hypothetical protein ACRC7O_17155, partial [Fimbriiglobus sp.]